MEIIIEKKITLEDILRDYFGLKGALTQATINNESGDIEEHFTKEASDCYANLVSFIYDLGEITPYIDSNKIVDDLDRIESEID